MANTSGVVGVLRALLTADTAQFDTSMRKAVVTTQTTTKAIGGLTKEVEKLTPQAERMVKSLGGERLLASANNLVAAVTRIGEAGGLAGGVAKLTEAQQRRVNAQVTEAIAKYRALGQTAPPEMLALAQATTKVAQATNTTVAPMAALSGSLSQANRLLGLFGASLSVGAVIGFTRSILQMGDEIVRVADQTGLTTEEVQRFQFIARQSGNTVEQIATALSFLQKNLGSTGATLDATRASVEKLGLNFDKLRVATPFEQMSQIAEAIGKIENPTARARAAFELFGRSGTALLPTLTAQFKALGDEAPIMSNQITRALDQAGDSLDKFQLQVKVWAAQSFNALSRGFDLLIKWDFQFLSSLEGWGAAVSETAAKIPGVGRALRALGLDAEGFRKQSQFFTDAANAQQLALDKMAEPAKRAAGGVAQFGDESEIAGNKAKAAAEKTSEYAKRLEMLAGLSAQAFGLDQIQAAQDMVDAIGGLSGVILMDADAQKRLNALLNEGIDAAQRNGQIVPLEWLRIEEATQANVGTLQDYLKLVGQLPEAMQAIPPPPELIPFKSELDTQRTIDLLTQNAPGSGIWKEAGGKIGTTLGGEITAKLKNAFEDIPHFLTSSVLHSGNFINGLKALGVSMADAIVEPLLKQFAMKIAGARIATAIAGGAGVAGAVSGTASAATAAVSGGAGAAAAGGGGLGASLAAFATNPWTIGIAAAVGGAFLLKRFFGRDEETKVNPLRDQFFAQFQSRFGGDQAGALAKAFSAAHTTADAADNAIRAVFRADKLASFRQAENRVLTMLQIGGLRGFQSFNMGGFVPPGVVQPAILHGPEWVIPQAEMNAMKAPTVPNVNINVHTHISAIDTQGVREFVESPGFLSPLGNAIERNTGFLATRIQRSRTK